MMNLQENILRIKEVMGLLNEQSQNQIVSISDTVSYQGTQTDWDMVHAIFGSKRLDDDLEQRVSDELSKGNYRVINVSISSQLSGNDIITEGQVELRPVKPGENPHKRFTTRGSIGGSYEERHDQQVNGLSQRLMDAFKGKVTTFGPYTVTIKIDENNSVKYKQSFFAVEDNQTPTQQSQTTPSVSKQENSQYKVGDKFQAKRSTDGRIYTLEIKGVYGENSLFVKVTGPGTYNGKDLSRGYEGFELSSIRPYVLGGNMEMGTFTIQK
jgi:hypothetical protein